MPAGTRTAPDATTAATGKLVTFHLIDITGALRSDAYHVPVAATQAQIEAMGDALQAASGASLYKITVESVWSGAMSTGNASDVDVKSAQIQDQLFLTAKNSNPLIMAQRGYIPAPLAELFIGTSDNLDPDAPLLDAFNIAFIALIGAGYATVWGRYSQRTEINEKTVL